VALPTLWLLSVTLRTLDQQVVTGAIYIRPFLLTYLTGTGGNVNWVVQASFDPLTNPGVDIIFSNLWRDTDASAAELANIQGLFLAGTSVVSLSDRSDHDALGEHLGVPDTGPSKPAGTAFTATTTPFGFEDGPFGDPNAAGFSSNYDYSDLNLGGAPAGFTVVATDSSGDPVAVFYPPGVYAAGAGALLVVGDVNIFTHGTPFPPSGSPNGDGVFALNAMVQLSNTGSSPPSGPSCVSCGGVPCGSFDGTTFTAC